MLLRLLCLAVLGVHLSSQDMVTLAPSEVTGEVTDATTSSTPTQKLNAKPNIRSFHVTSNIKYRYATTLVSTKVINTEDQAGEATFVVTLPESAFISEFLMELKDKVYKAYVKEKEEAKAVYNQAVQAGQFAGHVAQDARDSNSFTVSVNIEARGKVTFNLTYEQLLSRNLGLYHNVITLNPNQIVEDMSVKVDIEEPTEITHLEVPEIQDSNNIVEDDVKENKLAKIEMKSPNHKIVTWAPTPEEQQSQNSTGVSGQFIVKYDVDRAANPQQILVDEGYFVHFFAPENLPKLKKHVVFVLDYSGSMEGRKLEQLKEAMKKILSDLQPTDYFSIVIFHSNVIVWSPNKTYITPEQNAPAWQREEVKPSNVTLDDEFVLQASPANIDSALTYLNNYNDLGATNIMGGLRAGLKLTEIGHKKLADDPPQAIVIFLTDGQPNVEVYDTNEIIAKTKPLNVLKAPVFSLAFGYGADSKFLRKMSLSNYAFARDIYEAADAAAQLKNFYSTISSPLFANVTFTYLPGQVDNTTSTKHDFPIYFLGSEIVVAGKFDKEAVKDETTIGELSGVSVDGIKRFPIIIDRPPKPKSHTVGHLEKTWAYLTIQQLLDKADSLDDGADKNQTKAKALQLALQYSFVTPLTSLVVVKPNETESAVNTEKVKPGAEPAGVYALSGVGGFGGGAPGIAAAFPAYSSSQSLAYPHSTMLLVRTRPKVSFRPIMYKKQQYGDDTDSYDDTYGMSTNGGMRPMMASYPAPLPPMAPHTYISTSAPVFSDPVPLPQKVALDDVKWLQPLNSTITLEGKEYNLGLNETDTSFGNCTAEGEAGECRHIKFCALDVFQNEISLFKPYQCPITGEFLGVCCPHNVS